MAKTLIGTATTDANGVATVTYTATGAGDVIIQAESDNLKSNFVDITVLLFCPPLDGTDNITKWTSATNKTENGIFYSHGSFLTEGWSNNGLWQLDFDCMSSLWKYVGLMPICSEEINPFTDAKNTNYAMTTWEGFGYVAGLGASVVNEDSYSKNTANVWHHMTIKKLSDTQIEIILDETYHSIRNVPNLANLTTLHIGTRDNPSSRNSGGIIQYKNIKVKLLPSISLVANQSVLSYADGDNVVLTATHSFGTGKTVNLYNANDNTLIGEMTDNEDGTYSYTYNSQGIGDLTVYASDGNVVSEDILIEDCYYANIGDTDKSSDFDIANAWTSKNVALGTVTVTNDNEWYTITRTGGGQNYAFLPLSPLTGINKAFTFSCVIEAISSSPYTGTYNGLYGENYNACWSTAVPCRIVTTTTGSSDNWNKIYDISMSQGIYRMELTFDGVSYNYKLYDSNGTLQQNLSTTMNSQLNNTTNTVRYGIVITNGTTVTFRIKNIKAKTL